MKRFKRVALAVGVGLVLTLLGGACTTQTGVTTIGLYYTGGWHEGEHFEKVILPGSGAQFRGWGDSIVRLPVNQRNYIVSKAEGEGDRQGADVIRVPAKGGVLMDFEVAVYFKLNTHTDDIKGFKGGTLRKFNEQICRKYNCDDGGGWDKMLNDNFRKILETSMRQRVFNYSVDELFANAEGQASGSEDAILKIQSDIASTIKTNVNKVLGGQYFCGPKFDRDKKECPDFEFVINSAEPASKAVRQSFDAVRSAANEAQASKARAEGTKASQQASQVALTPEYLRFLEIQAMQSCAKSANCTLVVTPGGNVNVNTK